MTYILPDDTQNSVVGEPIMEHSADPNDDNTEKEFYMHLTKWQEETMMLSSPTMIINNASFQKIIAMGKVGVPYILKEIKKQPSCLVWALNIIYNRKISDNRHTTISEACRLWAKELERK